MGFEDFVRVGSVRKIAKPVLPYSVHSTGSDSQELRELQEMLKGDLTPSERKWVQKKCFCSVLLCSVPFRFVPFRSVPFSSLPFRFCSGPFHSLPFHSVLSHSVIFHSVPFCSIPFCPVLLCSALSHTLCSARVTRYVSLTVLRQSLCHRPNGWAFVRALDSGRAVDCAPYICKTFLGYKYLDQPFPKRGFSISAPASVFFL